MHFYNFMPCTNQLGYKGGQGRIHDVINTAHTVACQRKSLRLKQHLAVKKKLGPIALAITKLYLTWKDQSIN